MESKPGATPPTGGFGTLAIERTFGSDRNGEQLGVMSEPRERWVVEWRSTQCITSGAVGGCSLLSSSDPTDFRSRNGPRALRHSLDSIEASDRWRRSRDPELPETAHNLTHRSRYLSWTRRRIQLVVLTH